MDDETVQDAIDYCCTNPDGLDTEELLSKFPEYRDELVPLLALCNLIEEIPRVPPQRYETMKHRIMAAAAVSQAAATQSTQAIPAQKAAKADTGRRIFILEWLKRPALAVGVLALLMVAFVWSASASSLPDNPFYNVKMLAENVSLNFANSPVEKARKHAELAEERLTDLEIMQQQHKLDMAGQAFSNYAEHLQQGQDLLNVIPAGEEKNAVAGVLYHTCRKGEVEFSGFDVAKLSPPVQSDYHISSIIQNSLSKLSANVLVASNIPLEQWIDKDTLSVLRQTPGPEATRIARFTPGVTGTALGTALSGAVTPSSGPATVTTEPGATMGTTQEATSNTGSPTPSAGLAIATQTAGGSAGITGTATAQISQSSTAMTAVASTTTSATPGLPALTQTGTPQTATTKNPTPTKQAGGTSTAQPTKQATTGTATPKSTQQPSKTATVRGNKPTFTAVSLTATVVPQLSNTPRPPSPTRIPPTVTQMLSTSTRVPPTVTQVPSTSTANPPTQTRIAPTNTEPTNTRVPPSSSPAPPTGTTPPSRTPALPTATEDSRAHPTRTPQDDTTPEPTRTPRNTPAPPPPPGSPPHTPRPTEVEPPEGGTRVPHPTATSLPQSQSPTPLSEPTPEDGSACRVKIKHVDASCASSRCLNWTAQVENKSGATLQLNWTVELEAKVGRGGSQVVASESGTDTFAVGTQDIGGLLCFDLSGNANNIKVNITISGDDPTCNQRAKSGNVDSCGEAPDPAT